MKLKIFLAVLILVINFRSIYCQEISCRYREPLDPVCFLTIINPNGFNNFTGVNVTHLEGVTDEDIKGLYKATGSYTTNVPSIICDTFKNAWKIYYDEIGIERIDEDSFKNCRKLEYLDLEWNKITRIDEKSFNENLQLETIILGNNQLATLPANVFENQQKLADLFLYANRISDLPENIFDSLQSLEYLHLEWNQIKNLNIKWFANLENLYSLSLDYNKIEELPKDAFSSLKNLVWIHLLYNNLTVIHADSFGTLPNLKNVVFTFNQIDAIDEKFIDNTGVTHLYMWENNCGDFYIVDNSASREIMRNELQKCFKNYKILFPETTTTITPTTTVAPLPPGCIGGNTDERVCKLEDRNDEMEEIIEDLVKQNEVLFKENEELRDEIKDLRNQSKAFSEALENLENKILELTPCFCGHQ